jgi:L-ascorbate 6-phosphate lactonase
MQTGKKLIDTISAAKVEKGHMAFWWIGQLGYIYKLAGRVVYIDAYLQDGKDRARPPVFSPEEAANADIVMGTHDHGDHIDRFAWPIIAKANPQAVFVCPAMLVRKLSSELAIPEERFCGIGDGETMNVKGIAIKGIASAHETLCRDPATGQYPCMGFVISADGILFYHSGDTCNYEGLETKLKAFGKLDAVFLPINGRSSYKYTHGCIGNMTYQEAVDLAGAIAPRSAVPGHYEMHAINFENPFAFEHYLRVKYPGISCWIGPYAQRVDIKGGFGIQDLS